MGIRHAFQSAIADDAADEAAGKVTPTRWNEDHALSWSVKTANYTAVAGDFILADTSGGVFAITLPASPSEGDAVTIKCGSSAATNNLTVGRNGSTIMGLAENMTVSENNVEFTLVYSGSTWAL